MEANGTTTEREPATRTAGAGASWDEEQIREKLRDFVRSQPWLAVAAAGALGAVLGGLVLSRVGRLAFIAAVGFVANELWNHGGRLEIDRLVSKMAAQARPSTERGS